MCVELLRCSVSSLGLAVLIKLMFSHGASV